MISFNHCWNVSQDIKKQLSNNFLQLNENKTEINKKMRMNIIEELGNPFPFISSQVRNLGVIIDSLIWSLGTVFINYVSFPNLNPFCLFKIWRRFFMLYCSITVILCIPQSSPTVGTKCSCKADDRGKEICQFYPHYTGFRSILVQFKILLFVFKALNNRAPSYLKVLLISLSTTRHLRSTDRALLSVPCSCLKTRAFSVNAPPSVEPIASRLPPCPFRYQFYIKIENIS